MAIPNELQPWIFKGPVHFYGLAESHSANGFAQRAETTVDVTGTYTTATGLIPAGSLVLGVTIRVITGISGPVTFRVGDAYNDYKWGTAISTTHDTGTTIEDFTVTNPKYYPTATDVYLTPYSSNFISGTVKVRVYYISLSAPTPGV